MPGDVPKPLKMILALGATCIGGKKSIVQTRAVDFCLLYVEQNLEKEAAGIFGASAFPSPLREGERRGLGLDKARSKACSNVGQTAGRVRT